MFEKGELIFYSNSGVCRVEDVGRLEQSRGTDRERDYYTLTLLHGGGTIFAPVDTRVFMRPILTAEEAHELIDGLGYMEANVCEERGVRSLTDHYHKAFQTHRPEDLLQLMKDIYVKGQRATAQGKRLGMTDQSYKKKAEDLIYSEFSTALGIPVVEVERYILHRLELHEKKQA